MPEVDEAELDPSGLRDRRGKLYVMEHALYDRIGSSYVTTRHADPSLAALLASALGDAETVLNVGAGAGAYEPADRDVVAVEPSAVMIAQRQANAAPVVKATAEALPFADQSFDVAMAVLSDHHWADRSRGLRELRRVARRRVVLFNADPSQAERFWLTTEYLPQFFDLIPACDRTVGSWRRGLEQALGPVSMISAPIPHDCADGFHGAFWRRPHAYLDPRVRAGISVFAKLRCAAVASAVDQLRHDLHTGVWTRRHHDLLDVPALDLGYYVVICELT